MHKKLLVLVLVFLLSVVSVLQFVGLAKANPSYSSTPIEPNKDPPILNVESPGNATYWNVDDVILRLSVTQPDSWNISSRITVVSYLFDGQEVILWDGNHETYRGMPVINWDLPKTSQFSAVLSDLTSGPNTLRVNVHAESDYFPNLPDWKFPTAYPMEVSETVHFTVGAVSDIPEFPSWAIVPLFLMATLAVMFYKKRGGKVLLSILSHRPSNFSKHRGILKLDVIYPPGIKLQ